MPLVDEPHCDAIRAVALELLDQAVLQFAGPLPLEKGNDLVTPLWKFAAIAPSAVSRVGERDARGVTRVPRVFSETDFLNGGFRLNGGNGGRRRRGRCSWQVTGPRDTQTTCLAVTLAKSISVPATLLM
jgi:hypothetical protein